MSDEKDLLVKNDNPQSDGSANSALSVETQNGTATGSVGDFNAAENDRQKKLILPFANEKVSETEDENVLSKRRKLQRSEILSLPSERQ